MLLATTHPTHPKFLFAEPKDITMHHARGNFTVDALPSSIAAPAEGIGRFSLKKELHGDLEGTGQGEMLTGGDFRQGTAGYVALETVTGSLHGKKGTFALQHSASMDSSGVKLTVTVVPGSGTGELRGVSGTFTIHNEGGNHTYEFDYQLPQ